MAKCEWCGREFWHTPYGFGRYCSRRCQEEANEAYEKKKAQKRTEDSEGGLWHFIKKVIKWILIIIFIIVAGVLSDIGMG